jgi:lysyl-tRNA synthetase class 2
MARLVRAIGLAATGLLALLVVLAAPGWLYVIQPRHAVPGPQLPTALPLDELSRRSAVPLVIFVAVWVAAGLALGLLARLAHVERLKAALVLALGVGTWQYLTTGISILVVRQIPTLEAFHAAARIPSVYIPAALAGLGAAVVGRKRARDRNVAPLMLSLLVGLAGLFDLFVGLFPEYERGMLEQFAPHAVKGVATALVAPIGLGLVVIARGLARRKRRAWLLSVLLLGGSAAIHLVHSVNYGAAATVLVALALIARRDDFAVRGDRARDPRILLRAIVLTLGIYAYGAATLWANRLMADQPFSPGFAWRETSAALFGLTVRGSPHLSGPFGQWFPLSIALLGMTSLTIVLAGWLAPWRYRHRHEAHERQLARALVQSWGADTLAPFVLRADKSYFFSPDERAFLAYRVVGGVAIVSGDPVGPETALADLVRRFIAFAHERDWRIAILGASEARLGLYRAHGLHALYHGDEAIVDVASFSLEGRPIRKVRQSVHRLEAAGYTATVLHPGQIDRALRAELEAVARAWRGDEPERGFVMALDALFRLEDEDAVFVVGVGPDGRPAGFLHFAVSRVGSALSLSSMPRLRTTPNGFNEWLVCEAIAWAREHDFQRVSLNFAPFAALLAPEAELSGLQHVERRALLALKGHFQLDNLLLFNRKFFPGWQRRFVIYERRRDLLRVGIAALAAEAYLPFSARDKT